MNARTRVLLVGPLPRPGLPVGGTQVSFAALRASFGTSRRFRVQAVGTTRSGAGPRALAEAVALARVLLAVATTRAEIVFFHASPRGMLSAAHWVALLCRLRKRRLVLRAFGGALDLFHERAGAGAKRRLGWALRSADLVLLQTRSLCQRFAALVPGARIRQLPTTRDVPSGETRRRCRRFLFLAQLRPEKGLSLAIEAVESPELRDHVSLAVHGPEMAGADLAPLAGSRRARYGGPIEPEAVPAVLARHDALVFPSTWPGEGLPGAVVEALQAGMPVIAARWRAIEELVEDGRSGLVVEPRSSADLARAMVRLVEDDALVARLSAGALERGAHYRSGPWHERLEGWLSEVLRGGGGPRSSLATLKPEPRRRAG